MVQESQKDDAFKLSLMHSVEKGCHFAVQFVTDQRWRDRYGWRHDQ